MAFVIRAEEERDRAAIRHVNRQAFGQDAEGQLVDALRAGGHVSVSLVAELQGEIVGHILFSHLPIVTATGTVAAQALAPMAVLPAHQRRGIGSQLVRAGLAACRLQGQRIVVVLGHPDYYPRFGFSAKRAEPLASAYAGPAFMALELVPGALAGVTGKVVYPEPFSSFG